jgi:hypothetical protein
MKQNEIGPDSTLCWSAAAIATQVNEEVVLMNLERDRCYGLGSTGSDIWRRLREPVSLRDLLQHIYAAYDGPHEQIEADVVRTLNQFAEEGLILVAAPQS